MKTPTSTPVVDAKLELVPAKNRTTAVFGGPADVPTHNYFHRAAMLSTAQAACFLVLAGAELQRRKKEVGHGGWEKWVEANCEYSLATAQRYMALTAGVTNKALRGALKDESATFMALLSTPVHQLMPEQEKELLESVHKLTDGETVQQLYLDFGITKKPRGSGAKGGAKPASTPAGEESPQAAAVDIWGPTLKTLAHEGLEEKSWVDLPDKGEISREALRGLLVDLQRLLAEPAAAKPAKKGAKGK